MILDAIPNSAARFAEYSTPGKLEWGVGLKVGDTVLARLPDSNGGKEEFTTAIIRWFGARGITELFIHEHRFGVEIKVCHVQW